MPLTRLYLQLIACMRCNEHNLFLGEDSVASFALLAANGNAGLFLKEKKRRTT